MSSSRTSTGRPRGGRRLAAVVFAAAVLGTACADDPVGEAVDPGADGAVREDPDIRVADDGGQLWIEHVEYSPSLVADGFPEVQIRLSAHLLDQGGHVPWAAAGTCQGMVEGTRSPIGRPADRAYLDVGDVTVSGGGSSFLLPRHEGGEDFLHRGHELFHELVMPEDPGAPLVGGAMVSISLGGSDEYPAGEIRDAVLLPRAIAPEASSLADLVLVRGADAFIDWTAIGGEQPDEGFYGVVMLVSPEGVVVEYCSESVATRATITAEALEAYLAYVPSGAGRLVRATQRLGRIDNSLDRNRIAWILAHRAVVQKFRIVDP